MLKNWCGWFFKSPLSPQIKPGLEELKKIMTAIENLTAAVTKLQSSVDAAVATINTPHPTDAAVQSAADSVNAQAARLDAAVNPPAPVVS